jgi:hypothetical protein
VSDVVDRLAWLGCRDNLTGAMSQWFEKEEIGDMAGEPLPSCRHPIVSLGKRPGNIQA